MSILREYQRQAVAAFWDALSPEVNRVAIEMATGLGKTITFAGVIDQYLDSQRSHPLPGEGRRALVLVERDELARQAVEKIQAVTRGRWSIGVVKAARNEVHADIVVASVATLRQTGRKQQIRDVGLIVVDECHHAITQSYEDILFYYGAMGQDGRNEPCSLHTGWASPGGDWVECSPGCLGNQRNTRVPVLGVTATLARSDGQGLGRIWQTLAFSRSLPWAQRKGFLIPLVPYTISIPEVDAGASDARLDAVLCEGIAPEAVVDAWLEKVDLSGGTEDEDLYKPDISTVLFAPLVKSAQAFADAFNAAGVKAEVVHGGQSDTERAAVLERYEAGTTTVVCNAMVLTEGWDSPRTMCVIVARPTKSKPLLIQMIGRGARPWLEAEAPPREEQRCIVLVVQGATTDLDIVADLREMLADEAAGRSALAMEDEWDIGKGIEDAPLLYTGPVRVEQWDALVQRSSKAWKYTAAGAPYLPIARKRAGYVFIVERSGEWLVFAYSGRAVESQRPGAFKLATAPDLELAMAIAEDEAQERGGDIGALLADKGRAWRKGVPSQAAQEEARRLGLGRELDRILVQRAAGKAGKLSDLIDKVQASRVLDPIVAKIRARSEGT